MKKTISILLVLTWLNTKAQLQGVDQQLIDNFNYQLHHLSHEHNMQVFNPEPNVYVRTWQNIRLEWPQIFEYRQNINTIGEGLMHTIFEIERLTHSEKEISSATRYVLSRIPSEYVLVVLERAIKENINHIDPTLPDDFLFRQKILKEVSNLINLKMKYQFPNYNYETTKKKPIKFVSIRSGNDLFTPTGIISSFYGKNYYVPDIPVFQRNDDRDYTGSFLLEIGTDYLNLLRRRPIKSYQTLLYGFDVFTPYFRDTSIFFADTTHNIKDRPHASFQYFGWSKKCISKYNRYRWVTTFKFGRIGGKTGENFQTALHQDISNSPRPKGWGHQIANGGRLGISLEGEQEFFIFQNDWHPNNSDFFKMNLISTIAEKIGTYMTMVTYGLQLTNKNFTENNQNFINKRTRQTVNYRLEHLMWNIGMNINYTFHNTMLEGYGIFSTSEKDSDILTPKSKYILDDCQIKRITYVTNITLSYTSRFATFFYNWKSYSPETNLAGIGVTSPSGNEMSLKNRWHHFAEIGIVYHLNN
jgi:hypothetical protein